MKIKHVQQPTPVTCVHACLSMVTGVPVDSLIERFGNQALAFDAEATVLVEHRIFPIKTTGDHRTFPFTGLYLVSAPSLNLPGQLHMVAVEATEYELKVYDPNTGRKGVKAYADDAITSGQLACVDVTYLEKSILQSMRPVMDAA